MGNNHSSNAAVTAGDPKQTLQSLLYDFLLDLGLMTAVDPTICITPSIALPALPISRDLCCIKEILKICPCVPDARTVYIEMADTFDGFDWVIKDWIRQNGERFRRFIEKQSSLCPILFQYKIRKEGIPDHDHATLLFFDPKTKKQWFLDPIHHDGHFSLMEKMQTTVLIDGYSPVVIIIPPTVTPVGVMETGGICNCLQACGPILLLLVVILGRFRVYDDDSFVRITEAFIETLSYIHDPISFRFRLQRWREAVHNACSPNPDPSKLLPLMGLLQTGNPLRDRFSPCGVLLLGGHFCQRLRQPAYGSLCEEHYKLMIRISK